MLCAGIAFLYLDTSHRERESAIELRLWWPKIRVGGWLCGDDYCNAPGLTRACEDFFHPTAGAWRNASRAGGAPPGPGEPAEGGEATMALQREQPTLRLWGSGQFCVGKGVDPMPDSRVQMALPPAGATACPKTKAAA